MSENTTPKEQQVVVDDVSYNVSDLSDAAKAQLGNVRVCEQKAVQLQQELGMIRTARAAYVEALKKSLEGTSGVKTISASSEAPAVETTTEDDANADA